MNEIPWAAILQRAAVQYAYCEIIRTPNETSKDVRFIEISPDFAKVLGLDLETILGRTAAELSDRVDAKTRLFLSYLRKGSEGAADAETEHHSSALDRWFSLRIVQPDTDHCCALLHDVTDRDRAIQNLLNREERNRRYIEHSPEAVFITDENIHAQIMNPSARKLLGYDQNQLAAITLAGIVPEEEWEKATSAFRDLRVRGKRSERISIIRNGGERIHVVCDGVALPEKQYMIVCRDVTERTRLFNNLERYQAAFQSISQPVVFMDGQGRINDMNDAFTRLVGYDREELIGHPINELNPDRSSYEHLGYTAEEINEHFEELWGNVKAGRPVSWKGVVINRKKSGEFVWLHLTANSIVDDHGRVTAYIGMPSDITAPREMEHQNRVTMYRTLAELAELRDDDTGNHMRRVGIFSRILAKELGMPDDFCSDIELFSPLHDIGKVGILDSILRAPRKLSEEEFAVMRTHASLGYNIMKGKPGFEMAAEITLSHHECYDGKGYPNGLAGKEIPLAAHITTIADVYDALRSDRPYKVGWDHQKTVRYLCDSSGTQFDPDVIEVFADSDARFAKTYETLAD